MFILTALIDAVKSAVDLKMKLKSPVWGCYYLRNRIIIATESCMLY